MDGYTSSALDVLSGEPQGTFLGPLLFLTYINDLQERTDSDARLFVDNCRVYRLQQNTERSHCLGRMWTQVGDEFPPGKVHRYSDLEEETASKNIMHGQQLEIVEYWKNRGVTISQEPHPYRHGQSYKNLGFLRRNFGKCTPSAKATANCTFIRPEIKYVSSMFDPHQATLTRKVEQVQRRFARFIHHNYRDTSPGYVTILMHQLEWDSLQQKRSRILHR